MRTFSRSTDRASSPAPRGTHWLCPVHRCWIRQLSSFHCICFISNCPIVDPRTVISNASNDTFGAREVKNRLGGDRTSDIEPTRHAMVAIFTW
jgi:hypothetical protein